MNKDAEAKKKKRLDEDSATRAARIEKNRLEKNSKVKKNEGKAIEVNVSEFLEKAVIDSFVVNVGTLNGGRKCKFCKALLFNRENSSFCCSNGKIHLASEQSRKKSPKVLVKLLERKNLFVM